MAWVPAPIPPCWADRETLTAMDVEQLQELSQQWEREVAWLERKSLVCWILWLLDPEYGYRKSRLLLAAKTYKARVDELIQFRKGANHG